MFKTADGGVTWSRISSVLAVDRLFFANDSIGFYTQLPLPMKVMKTTDGGVIWRHTLSSSQGIEFVRCAPGSQRIWTGGAKVFLSTDMGETWIEQDIPATPSGYLYDAAFWSEEVGVAVGTPSIVLYTSTGGVIVVVADAEEVPKTYALEQNYPNPFNPGTMIRYELPNRAHVILAVYNLLGERLATLVEQVQSAGNYEVTWDATGISTGVYFYRLVATSEETVGEKAFTETMRMVLLR